MDDQFLVEIAPAPTSAGEPFGAPVDYHDLIALAGFQNVVTQPTWPEIRLHERDGLDYIVDGYPPIYVMSIASKPDDGDLRATAREVIRRLAFGCRDYAAHEIVGRYHRDLERAGVNRPLPDEETIADRKRRMTEAAERDRAAWNAVVGEEHKL